MKQAPLRYTWLAAAAAISKKTLTTHRIAQTTHFAIPANQPDTFTVLSGKALYFQFGQLNINPGKRPSARFVCPVFMGLLPFDSLKESAHPSFSCGFCVHQLKKQQTSQKHGRIIATRPSSVQLIVVIYIINYSNGAKSSSRKGNSLWK